MEAPIPEDLKADYKDAFLRLDHMHGEESEDTIFGLVDCLIYRVAKAELAASNVIATEQTLLSGMQTLKDEVERLQAKEKVLVGTLGKVTEGHWVARTYNSHRRDCCSSWGSFSTQDEAYQAAQKEADTHNDSASEAYGDFECDYSSEELLEFARAALSGEAEAI